MVHSETNAILTRAEDILMTAEYGLTDLNGENILRRKVGLRNLIVFGRSFTFVLQNLRGKEPSFDDWYKSVQDKMRADPVFSFFLNARNILEKQGRLNTSISVNINNFSTSDLQRFEPKPEGAKSFFMGDQLDGSGWIVELPDGSEIKYYVELPSAIGVVEQHFSDIDEVKFPSLAGKNVNELSSEYLRKLSGILDDARAVFLSETPAQWVGKQRLPSYLRVVK
ncbi:MAG: hypothetical protein P8J02_01905 [Yoonia sp.]|nr:hypothetical protein [Yoonia sp.]